VNVLGGDLVIAGSLNATLTPAHPGGLIIDTDDSYPDAKSLDIDFQVTIYESDPGR